jgi:hypothetical protein
LGEVRNDRAAKSLTNKSLLNRSLPKRSLPQKVTAQQTAPTGEPKSDCTPRQTEKCGASMAVTGALLSRVRETSDGNCNVNEIYRRVIALFGVREHAAIGGDTRRYGCK